MVLVVQRRLNLVLLCSIICSIHCRWFTILVFATSRWKNGCTYVWVNRLQLSVLNFYPAVSNLKDICSLLPKRVHV